MSVDLILSVMVFVFVPAVLVVVERKMRKPAKAPAPILGTDRLLTAAELDAAEREVEVGPYSTEVRAAEAAAVREQRRVEYLARKEQDARSRERIAVLQEQGRSFVEIHSFEGLIVAVHEVPS